ncbi:MAG: threonine dehydratase [Formivibrio sp.]|nr:threonine dehydratase [Formivibrio sp.]
MQLPTLTELEQAADRIYRTLSPTPQYNWPLLSQRMDAQIWIKHENHTPTGAFKVRGGLLYLGELCDKQRPIGVISATRGNHGQSVGYAARQLGLPATIVVPHGNSRDKNAAMRALGVTLVEHGDDFQAAREYASALAEKEGLHPIPAFHPTLVRGVASYGLEFLKALPQLDRVYVPVGQGSGLCAMIAAKAALSHPVEIVGVVSSHAPAYALSFENHSLISHPVSTEIADGLACRVPDPQAMEIIWSGASRMVRVTDDEIARAIRILFSDTHNVAEGAGAAALAAALQEQAGNIGRKIGIVLSGGNMDAAPFARVLSAHMATEK